MNLRNKFTLILHVQETIVPLYLFNIKAKHISNKEKENKNYMIV